ncbi:phage GP46 family protein [Amphritea sp. HPY]|uniref:phage GP46 family protein n=1 Tax=Amphritea sp. HPY TaxID=3421652 RepID=UPI003D7DF03A
MSDFKTIFTDLTSGTQYNITDLGIEEDGTLATAVIISLFTNKRDPNAEPDDAQGWWADDIGSLRWTLAREKQLPEVARKLEQYDSDALLWVVSTGLAKTVQVAAEWVAMGVLKETISITLADGQLMQYQIEES